MKKRLKQVALALLAIAVVIQAVPYGRAHTNPPERLEPAWASPAVRALAVRACFDCHSNESRWPWYSHVAPMSWLIQRDVDEGRRKLNFSRWDRPQRRAKDAAKEVEEVEMPPWFYLPLHAEARLSTAERLELVEGLKALAPPASDGEGRGHDDGR
jgi:hypothetical protein